MAGSPNWKVYDPRGKYQAACKEPEAAACLATMYGDGSTVRFRHTLIVWREGQEDQPGAESYDAAAGTMYDRMSEAYGL